MKIILPCIVPDEFKSNALAQAAQQSMIDSLARLKRRSQEAYIELHTELVHPEKCREKPMTAWAELELVKITSSQPGNGVNHRQGHDSPGWNIRLLTAWPHTTESRVSNDPSVESLL